MTSRCVVCSVIDTRTVGVVVRLGGGGEINQSDRARERTKVQTQTRFAWKSFGINRLCALCSPCRRYRQRQLRPKTISSGIDGAATSLIALRRHVHGIGVLFERAVGFVQLRRVDIVCVNVCCTANVCNHHFACSGCWPPPPPLPPSPPMTMPINCTTALTRSEAVRTGLPNGRRHSHAHACIHAPNQLEHI